MAKRGAEALACPARCQSYFPRAPRPKRSRTDLEWREPGGRAAAPRREKESGRGGNGNGHGAHKRKLGAMEGGEDAARGNKRPAGPERSGAPRELPGRGRLFPEGGAAPEQQPLPRREVEAAAAASGDKSDGGLAPKRPEEHEDDAWHYNSFQYWRCPLPAIDLCDILDLEKDMLEAGDSSSVALSEMET